MKPILSTLLLLSLISCGGASENSTPQPTANTVPNSFFVTERPSNVKDLAEVKKTAKKDDDKVETFNLNSSIKRLKMNIL